MAKTTRKTTRRKTTAKTTKPAPAPKPAVAVTPPAMPPEAAILPPAQSTPDPVEAPEAALVLKKKDFLERVVQASGAKRSVARDISDAVLKVLGEALSNGESVMLPPLGKLRVARQIDRQGAEILQIKLRRPDPASGAKKDAETAEDPLAEVDD
jgi:nucleoid DNA-binding protein